MAEAEIRGSKTNKYLGPIALLLAGVLVGLVIKPALDSWKVTEKSYKTGGNVPRYLKEFRAVPYTLPPNNSETVAGAAAKAATIKQQFERAGQLAAKFGWFKAIKDEHVFVYVTNLGNLPFTIKLDEGEYSIQDGFDTSREPTMVVPLPEDAIASLVFFLQDGELTYEEQYKTYGFLSVPALQALYKNPKLNEPGDKSRLRFDDLVHIEVTPEKPVLLYGNPYVIQATAVNVDGQWLVFPGLQGEPDFKVAMTLQEATDLYSLGVYEVREIETVQQALDLSNRFIDFIEGTLEYLRPDHQRS